MTTDVHVLQAQVNRWEVSDNPMTHTLLLCYLTGLLVTAVLWNEVNDDAHEKWKLVDVVWVLAWPLVVPLLGGFSVTLKLVKWRRSKRKTVSGSKEKT